MKLETRFSGPIELELREDGHKAVAKGFAIVFDKNSEDLGGFIEVVRSEAVKPDENDLRALWAHDSGQILGRASAGTLKAEKRKEGLYVEIDLPNSPAGQTAREALKRGDVDGMSFGFMTRKDRWTEEDDKPAFRELLDIDLREVSIVTFPAYPDTSVALRSLEEVRKESTQEPEPEPEAYDPATDPDRLRRKSKTDANARLLK